MMLETFCKQPGLLLLLQRDGRVQLARGYWVDRSRDGREHSEVPWTQLLQDRLKQFDREFLK